MFLNSLMGAHPDSFAFIISGLGVQQTQYFNYLVTLWTQYNETVAEITPEVPLIGST